MTTRMTIWTWYYVVAPIFGTLCFLVGAAALFVFSFGRWRVRKWPRFDTPPDKRLEPLRAKIGTVTYFSADAALFLGLGILAGLVVLAASYFWLRSY